MRRFFRSKIISLLMAVLLAAMMLSALSALSACGGGGADLAKQQVSATIAAQTTKAEAAATEAQTTKAETTTAAQTTNEAATTAQAKQETATTKAKEETTTAAPTTAAPEPGFKLPIVDAPITLHLMARENQSPGAPTYGSGQLAIWNKIEEITNIKIRWDCVNESDYEQTVQTRLASNTEIPDMLTIGDPTPWIKQGLFIDMNPLISQYAPDIRRLFDENPDIEFSSMTSDGKVYCIPTVPKQVNEIHAKVMYLRQDWLDIVGMSVPTTMDEWYNVLKAFKTQDPNQNGLDDEIPLAVEFSPSNPVFENSFNRYFGGAFGLTFGYSGGWMVEDKKATYSYEHPNCKHFFEYMNRLVTEGLAVYVEPSQMIAEFGMDHAGSYEGWAHVQQMGLDLIKQGNPDTKASFVPAPAPSSAYNPNGFIVTPYATYDFAASTFITKNCKYPAEAVQWLNFLFTKEGILLTNFGIEGEHYTFVDGVPTFTEYWRSPESGGQRFFGGRPSISFFMMMEVDKAGKLLDPATAASIPIVQKYGKVPDFPKVVPSEAEADKIKSIEADLKTYVYESAAKFINGGKSIDEFDSFVQGMNNLGLPELKSIKQAQLDRFYAIMGG